MNLSQAQIIMSQTFKFYHVAQHDKTPVRSILLSRDTSFMLPRSDNML